MKKEILDVLVPVFDQAEDIFDHFDAVPNFKIEDRTRPGCNIELHVLFDYKARNYYGKHVDFEWQPCVESLQTFAARIKAYLLDCVDTFVNI